ncbi:succinylglutamate desuccinylase/aspartoacylase family protein [Pikeienuella sp. HZG-20]|uniref:succinylglutamate desuccinylase/aspartoacylase family protein n=1 Tax=Paludibacillus litoralis TaxID=3133267 RepID=UPI0030EEC545
MQQHSPLRDWTPGRAYTALSVTRRLAGDLALPLNTLTGARKGPTLAITTAIHGDETTPAMIVRSLFERLKCEDLTGRIAAVTVCNPPSVGAFGRQTPEQHGKTDLHEAFPGSAEGNLTQKIAHVLTRQVIDHADVLVDYHCGGSGGRLQERVDIHKDAPPEVRAKSLALARSFGTILVHDNALGNSAVGYANKQGKTAFNAETGGVYLAPADQDFYIKNGVEGFLRVLRQLGMIEGGAPKLRRQLLFATKARHEANPRQGGYLVSEFQSAQDLGKPVAKGTLLGTLYDLYTLEPVEELRAPADGILQFSRYSGAIDAGTKAFALAEEAASEWLDAQ